MKTEESVFEGERDSLWIDGKVEGYWCAGNWVMISFATRENVSK